jgi:hypothetical protein
MLRFVLFVVLIAFSSGCIAIVAGGVGAVGGYALSRDTFEGMTSQGQDEIWDAAQKVASIMGTVTEERRKQGELYATVQGANVTITIIPVNLTTTKLRVKARKTMFPRIGIAQEVFTKIIAQLE